MRAEKKLLAAIIHRAVLDMCSKPVRQRLTLDAQHAMWFIFKENTIAQTYLDLLDMDIINFRRNLLKTMYSGNSMDTLSLNKRNFRFNYNQYMADELKIADKKWSVAA